MILKTLMLIQILILTILLPGKTVNAQTAESTPIAGIRTLSQTAMEMIAQQEAAKAEGTAEAGGAVTNLNLEGNNPIADPVLAGNSNPTANAASTDNGNKTVNAVPAENSESAANAAPTGDAISAGNVAPAGDAISAGNVAPTGDTIVHEDAVIAELPEGTEDLDLTESILGAETSSWKGRKLSRRLGTVKGPSGKETYYNLNMRGIVNGLKEHGWIWSQIDPALRQNVSGDYYVRNDGCKMLGPYIMVAAHLGVHPRGSLVETTLGTGVVVDTGTFARSNAHQIDVAVNW